MEQISLKDQMMLQQIGSRNQVMLQANTTDQVKANELEFEVVELSTSNEDRLGEFVFYRSTTTCTTTC